MNSLRYLSIDECFTVYEQIKDWAWRWLARSGINSAIALASWARVENAFYIQKGHDYVVIVTDWHPNLKATIHPLFENKRMVHNRTAMQNEMVEFHKLLGVPRIQIGVGTKAGATVRHACERAGMTFEGTLRMSNLLSDGTYEDTEIWAHIQPLEGK